MVVAWQESIRAIILPELGLVRKCKTLDLVRKCKKLGLVRKWRDATGLLAVFLATLASPHLSCGFSWFKAGVIKHFLQMRRCNSGFLAVMAGTPWAVGASCHLFCWVQVVMLHHTGPGPGPGPHNHCTPGLTFSVPQYLHNFPWVIHLWLEIQIWSKSVWRRKDKL